MTATDEVADLFGQRTYAVRLDWGPVGARVAAADVTVIVDVLSFSTSVCVAIERGMRVYPYRWNGARAEAFARERDAVLAVGRLEAIKPGAVPAPSLSPAGLLECRPVPRLVLPSPNGSTIAAALSDVESEFVAGCIRNAEAVAAWLAAMLDRGDSVAIIAAGERWDYDDSLRPCLEDQLGAGAILSALVRRGYRPSMSPEATTAAVLFDALQENLAAHVRDCVGGRELVGRGYRRDVEVAAALNVSGVVPVLTDGAFRLAENEGEASDQCST